MFPAAQRFAEAPLRAKLSDRQGLYAVAGQLGVETFIHAPFIWFPVFYATKQIVERGGVTSTADAFNAAADIWTKYKSSIRDDFSVYVALFTPTFALQFAFAPLWARVPCTAMVSFVYTAYLSFTHGTPPA